MDTWIPNTSPCCIIDLRDEFAAAKSLECKDLFVYFALAFEMTSTAKRMHKFWQAEQTADYAWNSG